MGHPRPFLFFVIFSNKHYNSYNKYIYAKNVMSIQYTAPGFEPTTFGT